MPALVANVHRPASGMLTLPSFVVVVGDPEAAPALLASVEARTALELLRRRRIGEPLGRRRRGRARPHRGRRDRRRSDSSVHGDALQEELRGRAELAGAGGRDGRASAAACGRGAVAHRQPSTQATRDVVFADEDARMGDPAEAGRLHAAARARARAARPAIMQIHGGAWVVGSKDEQGVPLLNHLASNGWVGFNVEYRLSPNAKFPDHLRTASGPWRGSASTPTTTGWTPTSSPSPAVPPAVTSVR